MKTRFYLSRSSLGHVWVHVDEAEPKPQTRARGYMAALSADGPVGSAAWRMRVRRDVLPALRDMVARAIGRAEETPTPLDPTEDADGKALQHGAG